MDWKEAIEAIKTRAFEARIPLSKLCVEAKVANNSFWRWDRGRHQPSVSVIGRLEDALTRIERAREAGNCE